VNSEAQPNQTRLQGVEHAGVIDLMAHDRKTGVVTLAMTEPRPWDGSDLRLFQLQEKINAYLSFALDGEMAEAYPELAGCPLRLRLECMGDPDPQTARMIAMIRKQIALQGIEFDVIVAPESGGCGSGCGCHSEP
jgi:hypothetical protein